MWSQVLWQRHSVGSSGAVQINGTVSVVGGVTVVVDSGTGVVVSGCEVTEVVVSIVVVRTVVSSVTSLYMHASADST